MSLLQGWRVVVLGGVLGSLLLAALLDRLAEAPSADVGRGTEAVFGRGLQARELTRQGPRRWTGPQARFVFERLPEGAGTLELRARGHRGPVIVAVEGSAVGRLDPGQTALDVPIVVGGRGLLRVELAAQSPLVSGGRSLGTQLERVTLRLDAARPQRRSTLGLAVALTLPGLALWVAAVASGFGHRAAAALWLAIAGGAGSMLCVGGMLRSPYATWVGASLTAAAGLAFAFARLGPRTEHRSAYLAALAALLVQGLLATAPFMVVSDAVFHGNKLLQVSAGDWFPTSVTQHARPFEIPYGVSFYAWLVPLARLGCDPVVAVRLGAAVAGVLGSALLYRLVARWRGARPACVAVVLLQLLPGTFLSYSYGNLSNVFGEATSVAFFAWWSGVLAGGALAGGVLWAASALAHLSSAILLAPWSIALAWMRRHSLRIESRRWLALLVGLGLALAYYAHFLPLVRAQLGRLAEGGGPGRGGFTGLAGAARLALVNVAGQWSVPAVLLALAGAPRPRAGDFDRDLVATWVAGGVMWLAALFSPLDVRYLLFLSLPLSVAMADGVERLGRLGRAGWALAGVVALWLAWVGGAGILEALFHRYRT